MSKFLKQYRWALLALVGLSLGLSAALAIRLYHVNSSTFPEATSIDRPVIALDLPTPRMRSRAVPVPQDSPATPSAAQSPASPAPESAAPRTATQEAMSQEKRAEFEDSIASVDALVEMRVGIAEGVASLTVGTSTGADVLSENGQALLTLSPETTYTAQPNGQAIALDGSSLPAVVLISPYPDGLLYINDRPYRGRLLLVSDQNSIWAVNFVNLRSYLYSVVGSEVSPSWPMEALKAQAVAARSYALTYFFRPVNSVYQIGATEYYQVYRGTEREADTIRQAVDATAGQFVSYQGGIVESLYAASDDIVMDAFQGKGMSQLGALNLAEQGYTYTQILSNYYPGTGVGQIVQDTE